MQDYTHYLLCLHKGDSAKVAAKKNSYVSHLKSAVDTVQAHLSLVLYAASMSRLFSNAVMSTSGPLGRLKSTNAQSSDEVLQ